MKKKPFELNDRVYDLSLGWGTILCINKSEYFQDKPQPFKYEVKFDNG